MPARIIWSLVVATLIAATFVAASLFVGGDRRVLVIGETTDAHHRLEMSCETCHGAPSFADAAEAVQTVNKACRNCHDDELDDADDSHPHSKFRNPIMAAYWEKLDARLCTTCHIEHRPEITGDSAVTVTLDFCRACHSEGDQDVRADRPSHAAVTFDTCASAGCHNFLDNRALRGLPRQARQYAVARGFAHPRAFCTWPWSRAHDRSSPLPGRCPGTRRRACRSRVPRRLVAFGTPTRGVAFGVVAFGTPTRGVPFGTPTRRRQLHRLSRHGGPVRDTHPPTSTAPAVTPRGRVRGVAFGTPTCGVAFGTPTRRARVRDTHPPTSTAPGCHATNAADDATLAELAAHWIDAPPMAVCVDCQRVQARTFALGRHGMRGHPKIAKPRDPQRALSDLELEGLMPDAVVARFTDPCPVAHDRRGSAASDARGRSGSITWTAAVVTSPTTSTRGMPPWTPARRATPIHIPARTSKVPTTPSGARNLPARPQPEQASVARPAT